MIKVFEVFPGSVNEASVWKGGVLHLEAELYPVNILTSEVRGVQGDHRDSCGGSLVVRGDVGTLCRADYEDKPE